MFRWTLFWTRGFVPLSNWLIFKLRFQERNVMRSMRAYNKQQLSDLFIRDLPTLKPYLPQTSENLRPHSSNSIENATPL